MWTHPIEASGVGGQRGRAIGVYLGGTTIRLRHRRSRFGGLRAGGSAERGWPGPRAFARVRRSRRLDLHSDALGVVHSDEYAEVQLVLSHRAEPHLDGRSLHTPRGKVLGGSSSINGLVYIRGNP